ncbi:type VI secretion system baseplate subunit TssE [Acidisoma cellulosilytica]|uniref:Type VI secretion system baseplate subunit TssE n=1 Tax=Acidisoma cellulosilyticum TaxID=2802395 RepID=A0A964E433_9PROT|nr:type VI secretion system baseplate subunit TssE [Acidisoma cellulosilyticum]MCB8881041.1 type VI secretion system baseplate subunit TssE [Acidisoma cellulosilyticum]
MRRLALAGHQATARQPRASVLDRLLGEDDADPMADRLDSLRDAVRRDLESLLNAHRPWRNVPAHLHQLRLSSFAFGLPDFTSGALNQPEPREFLRRDVENTIRRMEPRLTQVLVYLADEPDRLRSFLRLRIEAMLRVEPIVTRIAFDSIIDVSTADMTLQLRQGG